MNDLRTVTLEREFAHAPEKLWRALTQPHLIEAWLMKNNFVPAVGHSFRLTGDWGGADCRVLEIEPQRSLSYTWVAMGLDSVVTWTLTPTAGGTLLRMDQSGFRPDQEHAYQGAQYGWPKFFDAMAQVLETADAATAS